MRHPKGWKQQAGGGGIVPHHPVHHGRPQPHKKPQPPVKAHKKPKPAKKPKKPPAHKPARKWSPGWDVACCTAEAVGLLLGLTDAEVLDLYWATAVDADEGASIWDTLEVAGVLSGRTEAGLILGVTLPEPHAIAVTPDGRWWSWGEPFNPAGWPELIIDEVWAVNLCRR
jgi:hypothetical protein